MCSVANSYPTLGDPMNCSRPGSSVHRIFQARILAWSALPFPSPGAFPDPRIELMSLASPELAGRFFTTSATTAMGLGISEKSRVIQRNHPRKPHSFTDGKRDPERE